MTLTRQRPFSRRCARHARMPPTMYPHIGCRPETPLTRGLPRRCSENTRVTTGNRRDRRGALRWMCSSSEQFETSPPSLPDTTAVRTWASAGSLVRMPAVSTTPSTPRASSKSSHTDEWLLRLTTTIPGRFAAFSSPVNLNSKPNTKRPSRSRCGCPVRTQIRSPSDSATLPAVASISTERFCSAVNGDCEFHQFSVAILYTEWGEWLRIVRNSPISTMIRIKYSRTTRPRGTSLGECTESLWIASKQLTITKSANPDQSVCRRTALRWHLCDVSQPTRNRMLRQFTSPRPTGPAPVSSHSRRGVTRSRAGARLVTG